jgi:hypothetical protein
MELIIIMMLLCVSAMVLLARLSKGALAGAQGDVQEGAAERTTACEDEHDAVVFLVPVERILDFFIYVSRAAALHSESGEVRGAGCPEGLCIILCPLTS